MSMEIAGQIVDKPRRKGTGGVDHVSLRPMLAEFERFGKWWVQNVAYENYTLPVVHTIQTHGRRTERLAHFQAAYDWEQGEDSQRYGWSTKEGGAVHEINLSPEAFLEDPYFILHNVAHEYVHCFQWEIQEKGTAKSGRHNALFAERAQEFGLVTEKHPKVGYTTTGFTDEMRKRVEKEFDPDIAAFTAFKEELPPPKPTRKSTVAFHVLEDESAPVIRLAKGKADEADGNLTWRVGGEVYHYVRKSD